MTRVLVIDDEPQILRALRINLSVRGYEVHTAATGVEALTVAAEHKPDVVVLDLGLPDMSGIEVLEGLRGWLTAPVIVLSARTDSSDKVEALDAGADDYVTKPFGMDEFLARLRAAVRRGRRRSTPISRWSKQPPSQWISRRRRSPAAGSTYTSRPPSGACWRCWCGTAANWSAATSCSKRCGDPRTRRKPITSACISRNCGANSRTTRRTPSTC